MRTDVPATRTLVERVLVERHGLSSAQARQALTDHAEVVEQCVRVGSYVYYAADGLLERMGHVCTDACVQHDEPDEDE